jgi:hypothetical protein
MATWTLAEAQAHLDAWVAADLALASGQTASVGGVTLTRVDEQRLASRITFWRREVERLTAGRGPGARIMRVVPRDM